MFISRLATLEKAINLGIIQSPKSNISSSINVTITCQIDTFTEEKMQVCRTFIQNVLLYKQALEKGDVLRS